MANKVTQKERDALQAKAKVLVKKHKVNPMAQVDDLHDLAADLAAQEKVSQSRASGAIMHVVMRMRAEAIKARDAV